jgi:hypothetical protein
VVVTGAIGAQQPLDGLRIDGATDVTLGSVHLRGDLVIDASGVVTLNGPILLEGGSLVITGASRIVLGDVVITGGDLVLTADALRFLGTVRGDADHAVLLRGIGDGGAITVGEAGDGLVIDGALLDALQGFGRLQLGGADTGLLSIDAAVLARLQLGAFGAEADSIRIDGRGALSAVVELLSRGDIVMAPGALLASGDHMLTLRAAGDLVLAGLDSGSAGTVLVAGGRILDADMDSATNVRAAWLVMRGLGPVLATGESATAAAIDAEAERVDIDIEGGLILRDTAPDGRTRYNLLLDGVLHQQIEAQGPSSRAASGGDMDSDAQIASWLNALRPLSDLRDGETRQRHALAAGLADGLPAGSAAAVYLATLTAVPEAGADGLMLDTTGGLSAEAWGLAQRIAGGWVLGSAAAQPVAAGAAVGGDRFDYWEDDLEL